MSKVDRALHGPSWTEVILGAILSLILGVVIGAGLLIIKPVIVAKELPKEPVPGAIYYVEGNRGSAGRAQQVYAKRDALLQGQTVKLAEDEINSVIAATSGPLPGKPGEKPPAEQTLSAGTPNVRIRDGVMQVGVPITVNALGLSQNLIAQARGGFEKRGDVFVYAPDEIYLGSCPVQRLPFLSGYIRSKLVPSDSEHVPVEVAQAWSKLSNVTVEGNTLNLTM